MTDKTAEEVLIEYEFIANYYGGGRGNILKAMEQYAQIKSRPLVEALDGTVKYLIELAAAYDEDKPFKAVIFKRIEKIQTALQGFKNK